MLRRPQGEQRKQEEDITRAMFTNHGHDELQRSAGLTLKQRVNDILNRFNVSISTFTLVKIYKQANIKFLGVDLCATAKH